MIGRTPWSARGLAVLGFVLGCGAGPTTGSGPAVATFGSSPDPTTGFDEVDDDDDTSDPPEDEGEDEMDDETGSLDPDPSSTSDASETADSQAGTTGGDGDGDASSETAEPGPGVGQPDQGMYAHCFEADAGNCTPSSPLCMMIESEMEGVCTHAECGTPDDCDPAPLDATATPRCMAGLLAPEVEASFCVLDCADDRTCPAGMECFGPASFGEDYPAHEFCL